MDVVRKLYFKDFNKTKTGILGIKESSTEDLMDDVNQWLGRTGVALINVETRRLQELSATRLLN